MDAEALVAALRDALPGVDLESAPSIDLQATVYVGRDDLARVAPVVRDAAGLEFAFLADVTAVDFLPRVPRFEVVYTLVSIARAQRLRLKVRLDGAAARLRTVSDVWPAANWLEREVWDLFGIEFEGHPDPRRLIMPEDWEGFPLRKDYPVQLNEKVRTSSPMQLTEEEFRANMQREIGSPVADAADLLRATLAETAALHERAGADPRPVVDAAAAIIASLRSGGKLLLFGNGGSAADAQHVACELVSRFTRERQALAAIALTTDTSILTAIGNDYAFDTVFARQVAALGRRGDVAFGISTSGRSPNVVEGLKAARAIGMATIALTARDGGPVGGSADIHINVPTESTPRAQEVHMTLLHVICDLVEKSFVS